MKLKDLLSNILFPSRCVICDKVTPKDVFLCGSCFSYRVHPSGRADRCDICGFDPDVCSCGRNRYYSKAAVPFAGDTGARRAVYRLKYSSRLDKISPLAAYMEDSLTERDLIGQTDLITFIPMPEQTKKKRGFNQSELLAKALSERTGKECMPLLYQYLPNAVQHELSSVGRSGNVLGVYEPLENSADLFSGRRVLIVDDIMTTGSTLNEAAKTLMIFGAADVFCTAAVLTVKKKKTGQTRHADKKQS